MRSVRHLFSRLRFWIAILGLGCGAGGPLSAGENQATAKLSLRAPLDFQVVQRRSGGSAGVMVAGELPASLGETAVVEVRWGIGPSLTTNAWLKVAALEANQREFRGSVTVPAGGWYRFEIRVVAAARSVAEAAVEHVGVGEVFVVAGQSNSANHGEERQHPRSDRVVSFSGTRWAPADDPQPGASGDGGSFLPPLGDLLAERFGVPIGFVATGVGATSVREWLPEHARFPEPPTLTGNVAPVEGGGWESKGTLFESLTRRIRALGPNGCRAVLWHQGESDANQPDPKRTLPGGAYTRMLTELIRETRRAVGWEVPWFVAQASYHTPDDPGSAEIRGAQRAVWESGVAREGPNTDALVGEWRDGGGKGVHFSGPGLRVHAAKWAEKLGPWLERERATGAAESPGAK